MRHVISMLQPQLHCSRLATRFILSLSRSSADCAMHRTVTNESNKLLFHRDMFFRYADYLCTRIGELHLGRNQADQSSTEHDPVADPDPGNQRIHVGLNDGPLAVGGVARVVQIQILIEAPSNADF